MVKSDEIVTGVTATVTDVINYAIVDGEFIVSPETQAVNGSVITGAVLIFLSLLALGIGFFIRK